MARYFFDVTHGGASTVDDTGKDFASRGAVEAEIARVMADVARDCICKEKRGQVIAKARGETGQMAYFGTVMFSIKKIEDD